MNLDFSPEDVAFRDEVRAFIAENYPAGLREKQEEGEEMAKEDFLSWHRTLAKKGWVAPAWPQQYGGPGWTSVQRYIWSEETARADCVPILPFGINMVGAGDLHLRHARAEGALPAADPVGRHLVEPGLQRAGRGV
jgi:alkylation response protein AidB-like acyl-CoA dehydrogenase